MRSSPPDAKNAGSPAPALDAGLAGHFQLLRGECPYGFDKIAVYHEASVLPAEFYRSDRLMGDLLANGYRRNGGHMYTMRCPDCQGCVSIRLDPQRFRPNRNQRRVWRRNADIVVQPAPGPSPDPAGPLAPVTVSARKIALLSRFLSERFDNDRNEAWGYYLGFFLSPLGNCWELRYWAGERLVGVGIVDVSPDWLNAVYFFFDPDERARSLGTFNILTLIAFCREHKIPRLYLGYCIEGLSAMDYKRAFRPHELLIDGKWREGE